MREEGGKEGRGKGLGKEEERERESAWKEKEWRERGWDEGRRREREGEREGGREGGRPHTMGCNNCFWDAHRPAQHCMLCIKCFSPTRELPREQWRNAAIKTGPT